MARERNREPLAALEMSTLAECQPLAATLPPTLARHHWGTREAVGSLCTYYLSQLHAELPLSQTVQLLVVLKIEPLK